MAQKNESFGCFVVVIALAAIVWFILPDSWTGPIFYSLDYSISLDQVHWTNKPSDCNWGHAPLGDKGCHYKKMVVASNAAGTVVAGDDAPKYSHDTKTGSPIVSYDNGKTWDWLPTDVPYPDMTVKRIEIRWIKVED